MSVDDHEILAHVSLFGFTIYPHKKTKKGSINAQPISSVNCKQSLQGVTVTFPGFVVIGRNPFKENFQKFWSKTQWISSVQLEKFRKNGSTF